MLQPLNCASRHRAISAIIIRNSNPDISRGSRCVQCDLLFCMLIGLDDSVEDGHGGQDVGSDGLSGIYLLLSVFGGAAHNVGQLIAARFIISNQYVWYYLPVLLAAGLLMGAITGMALRVVMPYLDRLSLK